MTIKGLVCTRDLEFRVSNDDGENDGRTLRGYAAVFDQETQINSWEGRFSERIAKGAFRKTLKEKKPICQFNHGRDQRTGQVPIGVFTELREDDQGLYVESRLFDNDLVEPIRQAIEGEAITGMSFTFNVVRDEWRDNKGKLVKGDEIYRLLYEPGDRGPLQRTVKEVKLYEAGPVTHPAYEGTSVGVRSADDLTEAERRDVVELYRKSMHDPEPAEVNYHGSLNDLHAWLDAERTHQWLEAERTHLWIEAEKAHQEKTLDDAASRGTSSEPDNAVHSDTLHRESKEKDKQEPEAPNNVRTRVMTLDELRQRKLELEARLEELGEEYRDAEMPEAEQREWDEAEADVAKVAKSIERIEKRMEAVKGLAVDGKAERGTDRGPAFRNKSENIFDVEAIRRDSYNDEDFASRLRDNAMRANDDFRFPGVVEREEAQGNISHALDYLDDDNGTFAKRILTCGSPAYERAWAKAVSAGNPNALQGEEYRAMTLGTDNQGGYAVPVQLDPTIIWTSAGVANPLRQIARVEKITGKEWQGITSAGTTVTRAAEAAEVGDNSFTLGSPTVRTKRVHGFVPFSYELAESWNQVRGAITEALADAKNREEATSFLTGDGTGNNPNGLITTLSGNTVNATTGQTFTAANVYAMEEALDYRYRANAHWMANKAIYNKVRQFDTQGGAQLWERIGAGQPSELLGYPVHEATAMSGLTTTGTKFAVFGDFRNFLIVDRLGMSVELIPQVFGANQRPTGQRGIYAIWMNNSKVLVDAAFKVLVGIV